MRRPVGAFRGVSAIPEFLLTGGNMMRNNMNFLHPNHSVLALSLALSSGAAWAVGPYPALPVALSASVQPNVLLMIDNSGSMGDCPGGATRNCTPKMTTAKNVATDLVKTNASLRWGVFSFDTSDINTSGLLQAPVGSSQATVLAAISALTDQTWTPLAETLFEMNRYWAGETSYYKKTKNLTNGVYTSPIRYRCQKNFNIVITDGEATQDDELPGNGSSYPKITYGAWSATGVDQPSLSFGICTTTTTAINGNISCPAKLEGATVARDLGNSGNRVSAVRDVSALLFDRDMKYKTAGTDDGGGNWDDPLFKKQNVQTYTVGFDVDNDVLQATAIVGKGDYYRATDEATLAAALKTAVSSIVNSMSTAGGLAVKGDSITSNNYIFQPIFDPNGWYGELRCYLNTGSFANGLGTPCTNSKATIPSAASRTIYTGTVAADATSAGGTTSAFQFNTSNISLLSTAQQNALGVTSTDRQNLVNFLRGSDINGFRLRPNGRLGDSIDAQPLVIGAPAGQSIDADYASFAAANVNRGLVLLGANDGMMHTFRMSDLSEIYAYIPSPVYPNLAVLDDVSYGLSVTSPHAYHVNGAARKADIKVNNAWMTLAVSGLAQGGQGYFALDVTNDSKASAASTLQWEWTDINDARMGYSFGAPIIYNVRTSATTVEPAVIFSNGYENTFDDTASGGLKAASKSSVLYILNAKTGKRMASITVPSSLTQPSEGLSAPVGVDVGQDGVLDYVYAGDVNGNLWRFDLTKAGPSNFFVQPNPIFKTASGQPIINRPAVMPVTRSSDNAPLGNLVYFGTGKLLVDDDRSDQTVQSFYAVLDDMSPTTSTRTRADLQQRTVTASAVISTNGYRSGAYRQISSTPTLDLRSPTNTVKGWYLDLPLSTERVVTSPVLMSDRVVFGTGIPKVTDPCVPGGAGWVMGLNPLTGSVTTGKTGSAFSFVDVKLDGRSSADDKVDFSTGSSFVSGYSVAGIPTELSFISKGSSTAQVDSANTGLGNAGAVIALESANSMAVFTGNAGGQSVTTGNQIPRPEPNSKGTLCAGLKGQTSVDCSDQNKSTTAIKLQATIWREIK